MGESTVIARAFCEPAPRATFSTQRAAQLAHNLRSARQGAVMTQERLAEASGVTTPHIATIEGSRGNPTLATLYALADALGVRAADLLPA